MSEERSKEKYEEKSEGSETWKAGSIDVKQRR